MNHDQITREYRAAHTASLDAEVRALRLTRVADSITSWMSLGELDEMMDGIRIGSAKRVSGMSFATVSIDRPYEVPILGAGSTLAEALADAVRSLATMQTVRAAEKRKMAARWLESLDMAQATAMDDLHPTHEEKAL